MGEAATSLLSDTIRHVYAIRFHRRCAVWFWMLLTRSMAGIHVLWLHMSLDSIEGGNALGLLVWLDSIDGGYAVWQWTPLNPTDGGYALWFWILLTRSVSHGIRKPIWKDVISRIDEKVHWYLAIFQCSMPERGLRLRER